MTFKVTTEDVKYAVPFYRLPPQTVQLVSPAVLDYYAQQGAARDKRQRVIDELLEDATGRSPRKAGR
jgi:hypothetical protein